MLIYVHITVALLSLVAVALAYMKVSRFYLNTSLVLTASTLISGTILVVTTSQNLMHACVSGLVYLAISMTGIVLSKHKLLASENA